MRLRIIEDAERVALANRRGRAAPAAPPELGLGLEKAAIAGDQRAFAALLALALSTSPDKARRILDDRSGETLAVALVAIGLTDEVITRIFMFRDPLIGHSTQKLFALVDLSRRVSFGAAGLIMSAILGQEPRAATHRPAADPRIARWSAQWIARPNARSRRRSAPSRSGSRTADPPDPTSRQPFMPPLVSPPTTRSWKTAIRMETGTIATMSAAEMIGQGNENSP